MMPFNINFKWRGIKYEEEAGKIIFTISLAESDIRRYNKFENFLLEVG